MAGLVAGGHVHRIGLHALEQRGLEVALRPVVDDLSRAGAEPRDVPPRAVAGGLRLGRARLRGQLRPVDQLREARHVAGGQRVRLVVLHPVVAGDRASQAVQPEDRPQRGRREQRLGGGDLRVGRAGGEHRRLLSHRAEGDVVDALGRRRGRRARIAHVRRSEVLPGPVGQPGGQPDSPRAGHREQRAREWRR